ncbi:MAG: hypothetical protein ACXWT1_20310 [Methylobacter sp.]
MRTQCKYYFLLLLLSVFLVSTENSHAAGETSRISADSAGTQGNLYSYPASISVDGRYVAFSSGADNLVPGDTNVYDDIFVHDRLTGEITRVSVDSAGKQGNDNSNSPSISADGRYVAFSSAAENLMPGDTNKATDVFVHDRLTHITTRISVHSNGGQTGYLRSSSASVISADGRYVAFTSKAENLVSNDTCCSDIFVHDRLTGKTTRVSVDPTGLGGNSWSGHLSINADGRYVAFSSRASNLVPGDGNNAADIFVRDRMNATTTRVSVNSAGLEANGGSFHASISADGRYVAFESSANNLVPGDTCCSDIFVHDRTTAITTRVSVKSSGAGGNRGSGSPFISADGRYVAFVSDASNLVTGDTNDTLDIFVHDRITAKTTRVSLDTAGGEGNNRSDTPSLSADGRYVAFDSVASNLVADDSNEAVDVFVRDRLLNTSQSADIQLDVTTQPASVQNGQIASYLFTIRNQGLVGAGSVTLIDSVSGGKIWSITPSQGDCIKAAVSVCRLHSLAAGASATVRIKFKAKVDPLTQQVSVSTAPVDNVPANNGVAVSTPVTP